VAGTGHIIAAAFRDRRHSGQAGQRGLAEHDDFQAPGCWPDHVPAPRGDITVKWASSPAGFAIAVQAPGGITGTVMLPKGASRYSVTVNRKPVPVAPGQATVSVR